MVELAEVVNFCDNETSQSEFKDYKGAFNGLQIENRGTVTKIGASVDASFESFQLAKEEGVDFLITHHGPFWGPTVPLTGVNYQKFKYAFDHNLAVYGSHLPLDAHPEIGNNAILARRVGLTPSIRFGQFENQMIGWAASTEQSFETLQSTLENQFNDVISLQHGPTQINKVGIMTGSGGSLLPELPNLGIDTLITGECAQHHFAMSQELEINLFLCGHYATEVFGVQALAKKVASSYNLPWCFLDTHCPL